MIGGFLSSDKRSQQLWTALSSKQAVTRDQFRMAQATARRESRTVTDVLLNSRELPAEVMLEAMGEHFGLPVVDLRSKVISPQVLNLIPKEVASQEATVIFKKIQDQIHVATASPENQRVIEFIRKKTGLEPVVFLTTPADIQHALKRYPGEIATEFANIIAAGLQAARSDESQEAVAQNLPIVQMVNTIIERALIRNASDIHIEPGADQVTIRFRVDGLLQRIVELPIELLQPLVARIKLLANLKIDEYRRPQDGRFTYTFREREVAIRVSIIPSLHGAKVALRLLDAKRQQLSLSALGLNTHDYAVLRREIARPHGLIVVTGPTGSGKTTTLYSLLRLLNKERSHVCTIEDPIEYGLEGVNQTQVNAELGLTFANGLRALLRQDPNVIMVGEIRDVETAEIAFQAAMTGHLVLTTLHTNSAYQAPQRLAEMGVPPFLVASVTSLIVGQRLVRKNCEHCRTRTKITPKALTAWPNLDLPKVVDRLRAVDLVADDRRWSDFSLISGRGCERCGETGFRGRHGMYELLSVDEAVHDLIVSQASPEVLRKAAIKQGGLTMIEDGVLKALNGVTTLGEVFRVVT